MKILTKIKLINWHGFYDDNIDINGKTLVTGENGSGKSTFLDACYFLLTGGDTDKFNTAANDHANRTLESYMRGKTGIEGKKYLREDSFLISHIVMEFYDDLSKKHFILGVVLEIQEGKNKIGRTFYAVQSQLNEEYFNYTKDNIKYYLNFQGMKNKIGRDIIQELDGSKEDIRSKIYTILSLEKKKYYELLPKAVAFRPIPDVNDFVYKFLMPQKDVNLENVKTSIRTYNDLNIIIKQDEDKRNALVNIVTDGTKYYSLLLENKLLHAYKTKKNIDEINKKNNILKSHIQKNNILLSDKKSEIESLEKLIKRLNEEYYELTHSEQYLAIETINKDIINKKNEKESAEQEVSIFNKNINEEQILAQKLGLTVNLTKYIKSKDFITFSSYVQEYKELINKTRNEISEKNALVKLEIKKIIQEQNDLEIKRKKLESGYHSYEKNIVDLIEIIHNGIFNSTGENINPTPFCELINVRPECEEWRDALEGYLNTRRFDLFVPEKHFDIAVSLYEEYKIEKKIYGVGLVNVAKIKNEEILHDSLAEKVISDHIDAQKYINYLLGKIICVPSEKELKNYESSINKTVMVYKNKVVRQTKPDIYKNPFIGRDAIRLQLEKVKLELNEIFNILKGKTQEQKDFEAIMNLINGSKATILANYNINCWHRYDLLINEYNDLLLRKEELEKNHGTLVTNVEKQKALIIKKEEENKKNEEEKHSIKSKIERDQENVKTNDNELSNLMPEYEQCLLDFKVKSQIDKYINEHELSINEIKTNYESNEKTLNRLETTLSFQMQSYINQFHFDASSSIDSLAIFINEYNNVVLRKLEKYTERLERIKKETIVTFQNAYISEIRKSIRDEKRNIDKLNKVLADKPFGSDEEVYQFKVTKSEDNAFGQYYDIFNSDENYSATDLFTSQMSDKNLDLMSELFKRLTQDTTDSKQLKIINQYTDYRSFMSYDIHIKNKRGDISKFSKINKEKSGGETQTPFYVIIAASFDQILQNDYGKRSSCGLVLFDEAFNNMDESHIESMMKYFSQLDIQPIIAVPSQRAKTIMPYVTTTIGLVKIRDRVIPRSQIKKNEEL